MAYADVENLVFHGEPSYVWLERIDELDIVEYMGRKQPTEYHPDVIPLICRFPFVEDDNIDFVCQQFLKLLVNSEKYLHQYKDRVDVLLFIAGFFEAAGYVGAVSQLIFHRNLLLKQGFENASSEVVTLNHAISNLYSRKFRV